MLVRKNYVKVYGSMEEKKSFYEGLCNLLGKDNVYFDGWKTLEEWFKLDKESSYYHDPLQFNTTIEANPEDLKALTSGKVTVSNYTDRYLCHRRNDTRITSVMQAMEITIDTPMNFNKALDLVLEQCPIEKLPFKLT